MSGLWPRRSGVVGAAALGAALLLMAAAPAAPPDAAAIFAQGVPPGLPACATCHGAEAQGNAAGGFPRLAGAPEAYLAAQLADFASGARPNAIMGPYAKLLDPAQQAALAAYLAGLPAPGIVPPTKQAGLGATLALDGRDEGRLPSCVSCHGPQGMGVGSSFPPLAGQPAAYIAAQLSAWQDGTRPPGPLGLMPAIAKRLSKEDIAAVAAYFAALVPAPEARP
jgi:cytochrome c553